ncbi:sperm motility kinase-like [Rattus rattus]|uniref:sperm motility kinase-like n=1 Tax=Rattus rattus TaxID=10117 RepID=UPI0013F393FE|nr:sperm motility kinase-like [Rattus rattus]
MTQTLVAIKILKRGTRKDFLVISEIDLMTSLYHNHIIRLLQVIDTERKTFLVMEYAAQGSLRKLVNKRGPLDEEEARSIFRELCLAVNYIHSQNIVHRDIKAENVLLDWEGHVKLSDFGLSKRLTSGEKAKGFCGTAQYCAPEVFGHTQYDMLPADIWSMGILLYYLQDKVSNTVPELFDTISPLSAAPKPVEEINDNRPNNETIYNRNIGPPLAVP